MSGSKVWCSKGLSSGPRVPLCAKIERLSATRLCRRSSPASGPRKAISCPTWGTKSTGSAVGCIVAGTLE
eukprot:3066695-Amphidinium_carterae.2